MLAIFCIGAIETAIRVKRSQYNRMAQTKGNQQFVNDKSVRILCIGDSHTQGMEAPDGKAYPDHLRRLFAQSCPSINVEVVNAGLGGRAMTAIRQNALNMLRHMNPAPDFLIIQGGMNAWTDIDYALAFIDEKEIRTPLWFGLARPLLLSRLFYLEIEPTRSLFVSSQFSDYVNRINYREYKLLVDECFKRNIQPVFLSYATWDNPSDATKVDVANEHRVPYLRFSQPATFQWMEKGKLIAPGMHPNAKGYGFVAEKLFGFLVKHFPKKLSCE
jgi:lysophospholipase L1-like esterase